MQRGELAAPSALVPLLGGCAKRHTQTGFVSLCRGVLGIALLQGANNGHLFFLELLGLGRMQPAYLVLHCLQSVKHAKGYFFEVLCSLVVPSALATRISIF